LQPERQPAPLGVDGECTQHVGDLVTPDAGEELDHAQMMPMKVLRQPA
jgi:hypothetical protein